MKLLLFIALIALSLQATEFASIEFSKEEVASALKFWSQVKNINSVPSLDIILGSNATEVEPVPAGTPVPRGDYGKQPYKTAGKLLFQTPRGGASCTAAAIGGNVVLTAGHCVHAGNSQGFYKNVVFIPQFYQGEEPVGRWAATNLWTTQEWSRSGATPNGLARDVAVFRVSSNGGRSLEQVVGKTTPVFTLNVGSPAISIGYPGNIGNGREMIQAQSNIETGDSWNPPTMRLRSTKTFGASGGPWFINGGQNVNSVNSYIKSNPSTHLYGPRFDSSIESLVKQAQ